MLMEKGLCLVDIELLVSVKKNMFAMIFLASRIRLVLAHSCTTKARNACLKPVISTFAVTLLNAPNRDRELCLVTRNRKPHQSEIR